MPRVARCARALALASLLSTCLALGCGGVQGVGSYRYFERPAPDDPWSRKIARWQDRERAEDAAVEAGGPSASTVAAGPSAPGGSSPDSLRAQYRAFRVEHKRELARELATWLQEEAKTHYIPDGPIDRWATLEETLAKNGDDCDGLELLGYQFLRDLGFRDEVFRAIVYRPSDNEHHMVTLWFEDPRDPWVIDPTGAMTTGMPHMSEVAGWVPLKLFTETAEYTVEGTSILHPRSGTDPAPAAPAR